VEEHKGSIETITQLGQGTTFIVKLPYEITGAVDTKEDGL